MLLALLLANANLCAAVLNLYTAEVDVVDRTEASVDEALAEALDRVLVKISGQGYASANGAYNNELKSWVQRYGFRSSKVAQEDGSRGKQLRAVISLDPKRVDEARAALGLPVWAGERPHIALWVALNDNGMRSFLPEGAEYARSSLTNSARRRGVVLTLPAVEADGEALTGAPGMADIWGGFPEQIMPNAKAVGADTVLLAAASHRGDQWEIRWNLLSLNSNARFTSNAFLLEEALIDGVGQVIDSIASSQSIDISDQGHWTESIDILHLPDGSAYQQLMSELISHNLIDKVQVGSAAGQRVRLVLELNASPGIVWGELDSTDQLNYVGIGIGGAAAVFDYQSIQ